MSWNYFGFKPYVPVAERQRRSTAELAKMAKKGLVVQPVHIDGRVIAKSFWGKAWCDNLESYMDYANRLPRGRTYVRNGSVVHLEVRPGAIVAMVCGSKLYKVQVNIAPVPQPKWKVVCRECAGGIGSLVELLQGRLSDRVMDIITRKGTGLFPAPPEVKMTCSCPDSAGLCKHIAAVFYAVGARLDQAPELLFVLRSVNHDELISQATDLSELTGKAAGATEELSESEVGDVFGIELDSPTPATLKTTSGATVNAADEPAAQNRERGTKRPAKNPRKLAKARSKRKTPGQ